MSTTAAERGIDRASPLGRCLFDDARARPLAPRAQQRLVADYQRTRDPRLVHKLVETNLRLVLKIALEHDRSHGRNLEDLVQEGTLGLMEAIQRFDASRGARLTTYAAFWIRAYVMKQIMDNVRVVRAVRSRADRVAFFRGECATAEVPLDAPMRGGRAGDGDGRSLADVIPDPAPAADQVVEAAELAQRVREAAAALAAQLPAREAAILKERLLADEPQPLDQVGRRLSLSGERVRQIERSLCAAIRQRLPFSDATA
jgi:RNA polymerase sigma-32 factor